MSITVSGTQHVEIEISPYEAQKLVLDYIRTHFDFHDCYINEKGKVIKDVTIDRRCEEWKTLRSATAMDRAVELVLDEIHKIDPDDDKEDNDE